MVNGTLDTGFSFKLQAAFASRTKPDSLEALLNEIIETCEPKAEPYFAANVTAAKNRGKTYIGPRCIRDQAKYLIDQIWSTNAKHRKDCREYFTGLAKVADGLDSFGEVSA